MRRELSCAAWLLTLLAATHLSPLADFFFLKDVARVPVAAAN
jgi:hypothetical protein